MTFIDDQSSKVYFLKYNPKKLKLLGKGKVRLNEIVLKIKRIIFDKGGEYKDTTFKKFCYEYGIKMERNVRSMPQNNDIAEWLNQTLTKEPEALV